ncbi:hypothetical protein GQ53DRAFT_134567 [Thozetella sp. PMI_491]|nr:hypothetical protein GQ53DRAFT_134567 [Thozetella sp. PMI_491]
MQPAGAGLRSRFGCTACRQKHRKCDEQRPTCRPCQMRSLDCVYEMTLKWTNVGSISSFSSTNPRQRNRPARRATVSGNPQRRPVISPPSTQTPTQDIQLNPSEVLPHTINSSRSFAEVEIAPQASFLAEPDVVRHSVESLHPNIVPVSLDVLRGLQAQPSDTQCLLWRDATQFDKAAHLDKTQDGGDSQIDDNIEDDAQLGASDGESAQLSIHEAPSEVASSFAGSSSWVIDSTLSNLFFQIFQNPGEEIAFAYFFKRVCTCIPAYDSSHNPFRKLALVALSYPVLLHGILSVSTAHMYNYGRSNEGLLSSRQSRALKSLQSALNALQESKDRNGSGRDQGSQLFSQGSVFSILSAHEIALAAVMMQTSSVLMTGIGDVEVHMRCALHFIQQLGYLYRPASSVFARVLIHRFAMVDVVLAHLRFRPPMAPLNFFMYQENDELDLSEPAFREIQGCSQRVLCFLARISVLNAHLINSTSQPAEIQAKAYSLETEMRVWGHGYYDAMACGTYANSTSPTSMTTMAQPLLDARPDLDVVCECFYWTAHILLLRRVFMDPTKSTRVQIIRRHMFRLMDALVPGCGPDSSLPFPFYIAAREATTLEERDWVRRKHAAMMEVYRDRSREYLMASTEKVWEKHAAGEVPISGNTPEWETPHERFIRDMDTQASYFMF